MNILLANSIGASNSRGTTVRTIGMATRYTVSLLKQRYIILGHVPCNISSVSAESRYSCQGWVEISFSLIYRCLTKQLYFASLVIVYCPLMNS